MIDQSSGSPAAPVRRGARRPTSSPAPSGVAPPARASSTSAPAVAAGVPACSARWTSPGSVRRRVGRPRRGAPASGPVTGPRHEVAGAPPAAETVHPGVVEHQAHAGGGEGGPGAGRGRPPRGGEPVDGQAEDVAAAQRGGEAQTGLVRGQAAVGTSGTDVGPRAVQQHRVAHPAPCGGPRGDLGVGLRADQPGRRHATGVEGVGERDGSRQRRTGPEAGDGDDQAGSHAPHEASRRCRPCVRGVNTAARVDDGLTPASTQVRSHGDDHMAGGHSRPVNRV